MRRSVGRSRIHQKEESVEPILDIRSGARTRNENCRNPNLFGVGLERRKEEDSHASEKAKGNYHSC